MSRDDKLTYFIQKLDGQKPQLENPEILSDFWNNAPAGRYTVEIKRIPKEKTYKQCETIFGLMIKDTIAQANDLGIDVSDFLKYLVDDKVPKGQGLTVDFLHELMYAICPTINEQGRRVTLSKMNTLQAAKLFDSFRNIVAPLGIHISEPDKNWREKVKDKE